MSHNWTRPYQVLDGWFRCSVCGMEKVVGKLETWYYHEGDDREDLKEVSCSEEIMESIIK